MLSIVTGKLFHCDPNSTIEEVAVPDGMKSCLEIDGEENSGNERSKFDTIELV